MLISCSSSSALASKISRLNYGINSLPFYCCMEAPRLFKCVLCTKRTKPKERRVLDGNTNKPLRKFLRKTFMSKVKDGDVICNKCRHGYYKERTKTSSGKSSKNSQCFPENSTLNETVSSANISFPIPSLGGSHS